jgi:hypothetical protein
MAANVPMRKLTLILFCIVQLTVQWLPPLVAVSLLDVGRVRAEGDAAQGVIINEIHYDPRIKATGEYVELYNAGPNVADLTGWSFGKGIDYVFPPGTQLLPAAYLVIGRSPAVLGQLYGVNAIGPFAGRLANDGDNLALYDRGGQLVDEVAYTLGFPWPTPSDDDDQSISLTNVLLDNAIPGAWRSSAPTPGRQNSNLVGNPPPFVDAVSHAPLAPRSTDTVTISARVGDADGVASVRLWLQRVLPGQYIRLNDPQYQAEWAQLPMQPAGDGMYVAQISQELRVNRSLVRYRVEAVDSGGRSVMTPYADDPQPNFAYFVYDGPAPWRGAINPKAFGLFRTVETYQFGQMRPLPVYNLLARKSDVEDSQFIPNSTLPGGYMGSDYPWHGTLVVAGVVYDHISFRARGGEYRYVTGKNHWKFNFTRGHGFQAYDDYGKRYPVKWDKLNFSAVLQHAQRKFRGEQGLFESLAYRLFNLAGVPAPNTQFVHFRVVDNWEEVTADQYMSEFWGLYLAIENMDGRFLDEHDLPDGNLYDMRSWSGELDNLGETGVGDKSDLTAFMNYYAWASPDAAWWRKTFDLDGYYRFRSILEAVHHYDVDQGKNYYYYLNPETGKWSILPWDLDLTWNEIMFGYGAEPFRDRVLAVPEFNVGYQNNLREIRDLLFNVDQMFPLIDETAAIINTPAAGLSIVDADRARWDYSPVLVSPYVSDDRGMNGKFYELAPDRAFTGMVQLVKEYVVRRTEWIDKALLTDRAFPETPSLSYAGPAGYPADQLLVRASGFRDPQGSDTFGAMQWRAAEIVRPGLPGYTENSRWRYEIESTWLSPQLTVYKSDTLVPRGACRTGVTCRVRVRVMDNSGRWSHWSAPLELVAGSPTLGPSKDLQISEIMYKPAPMDTLPGHELEFLELANTGTEPVDLSNMHFSEGIDYTFPAGVWLQPGAYLVLANHAGYFEEYYGYAPFAQYDKELSNQGERIVLLDAFGIPVINMIYSDAGAWPQAADGAGASLVAIGGDPNNPEAWRASTAIGGSPGAPDPVRVVINEVEADPISGAVTKVEIFNPSPYTAEIGSWQLTTTATPGRRMRIPQASSQGMRLAEGTSIPPGGYLTVDAGGTLPIGNTSKALALLSALPSGQLSGYTHYAYLPLPLAATTLGRLVTSDGREHFAAQAAPTWGGPNAGPQVPSIVVSALSVNPSDGVEWLEVTNTMPATARLYNPDNMQQRWLLSGPAYQLPAGVELPPGGRMLITSADPSDLCHSGRVPAGLRVLGPLPLPLTAQGVDLTLLQPTTWGAHWAYGEADGVYYRSQAPWPSQGTDVVLARTNLTGYGDEPANWQAIGASGTGSLAALRPGAIDPDAPADLCSFDAFINGDGKMEVRWVAKPLGNAISFRLLRSPLGDLDAKVVVATYPAGSAVQADAPEHVQLVDAQANPSQEYVYWLQAVAADDSVRNVAMTTVRTPVTVAFAPYAAP